jgi:hypothetical protein
MPEFKAKASLLQLVFAVIHQKSSFGCVGVA